MKRVTVLALALCVFLSGCADFSRLENQAHAVTMGIDYEGERFILTVQLPSFGGNGDGEKNESSSYLVYSAEGGDFTTAYSVLQATLPQRLNLTHLKTLVFSETFAKSDRYRETIESLMRLYSLSSNAFLIVSRCLARDFIINQKPHIGIRLSKILPSMLDYHVESGFIPRCTLSELFIALDGAYSTACLALADLPGKARETQSENAYLPGKLSRDGENENEYMGAALLNREKMAGSLNGREMQLMRFLSSGSFRSADFTHPCDFRLSTRKRAEIKVLTEGEAPEISVRLFFDVYPLNDLGNLDAIESALEAEFLALIQKCQTLGVEPFGFAEIAVKRFKTNKAWAEYDWLEKFQSANVQIEVQLYAEN